MRKLYFYIFLILSNTPIVMQAIAGEDDLNVRIFSQAPLSNYIWTGASFYDLDGAKQTGEYEYLKNALSFGGSIETFSINHALFCDFELFNKNDFFGDTHYSFSDLVHSRWITRRLWHNTENFELIDFDPSTASPGVDIRDDQQEYGTRTDINDASFRLKTPDFPFFLYANAHFVNREGTEQKRFLSGSGYFNDIKRVSTERHIDWETKEYEGGIKTHLGPIEIDLSHTDMKFYPEGSDATMTETFTGAGFPPGSIRVAGSYAHNRIPGLKGTAEKLRIHTNYTGKIFGSALLSRIERENEFSHAKTKNHIVQGDFLWLVFPELTFTTKYKFHKTEAESPLPPATVREPISSKKERLSTSVKYKLLKNTTLSTEYTHDRKQRDDTDALNWHLSDTVDQNIFRFSLKSKIFKKIKLKAAYSIKDIDEKTKGAALGILPNTLKQGDISLSYTPTSKISAYMKYFISRETKDDLQILNSSGVVVNSADKRETKKEKIYGSVFFSPYDNLSFIPSYTYIGNNIDQDIVYGAIAPVDSIIDQSIESNMRAQIYMINMNYKPLTNLNISCAFSFTDSKDVFSPRATEALDPLSIAAFSKTQIEERAFEVQTDYQISDHIGIGFKYRFKDYDLSSFDNPDNGQHHLFRFMLTKTW